MYRKKFREEVLRTTFGEEVLPVRLCPSVCLVGNSPCITVHVEKGNDVRERWLEKEKNISGSVEEETMTQTTTAYSTTT